MDSTNQTQFVTCPVQRNVKMQPATQPVAYKEGYTGQRLGACTTDNPYPSHSLTAIERFHWFRGWYDAYFVQLFPDWLSL